MADAAAVAEFVSVTGSDEATAHRFLAAAPGGSIEHAVSAFFNSEASEVVDVPVVVVAKPPPPVPARRHGDKPKSEPLPPAGGPDDFVIMDK